MLRLFIIATLAIGLTACVETMVDLGPSVGPGNLAGEVDGEVCDVESLDSRVAAIRYMIENDLKASQETAQLLRGQFGNVDAVVDAQHRNMVASCRTYARCMEMNWYDEGECRSSLAQWDRAQSDFADLTRELEEIEKLASQSRMPPGGGQRGGQPQRSMMGGFPVGAGRPN